MVDIRDAGSPGECVSCVCAQICPDYQTLFETVLILMACIVMFIILYKSAHTPYVFWFCPCIVACSCIVDCSMMVKMVLRSLPHYVHCTIARSSAHVILTRLHTPTRETPFKPKAGIIKILICMNYHDPNDKLNCNFHTFRPVIPFGFFLSPLLQAWGFRAKLYQRLHENQRNQHQKVRDHG